MGPSRALPNPLDGYIGDMGSWGWSHGDPDGVEEAPKGPQKGVHLGVPPPAGGRTGCSKSERVKEWILVKTPGSDPLEGTPGYPIWEPIWAPHLGTTGTTKWAIWVMRYTLRWPYGGIPDDHQLIPYSTPLNGTLRWGPRMGSQMALLGVSPDPSDRADPSDPLISRAPPSLNGLYRVTPSGR